MDNIKLTSVIPVDMKNESSKQAPKKALRQPSTVVRRIEQLQNCNCKRFEQKIDGRFYCCDCGKAEYTVL